MRTLLIMLMSAAIGCAIGAYGAIFHPEYLLEWLGDSDPVLYDYEGTVADRRVLRQSIGEAPDAVQIIWKVDVDLDKAQPTKGGRVKVRCLTKPPSFLRNGEAYTIVGCR